MRQLPAPAVEQLLSVEPGAAIVGACPVGDALMGSALMAATSDGKLHCLRPSGARNPDMVRVPDCEALSDPRYAPNVLTRSFVHLLLARASKFHTCAAGGGGHEHRRRRRCGQC